MAAITWDEVGKREYETGVDHGVLYPLSASNTYDTGVAWNGLISISENPSGAESSPKYADNIKYLDMTSAEEFGCTIEAFTYPPEFELCDGTAELAPGVTVSQQARQTFGLSYRTKVGNDTEGNEHGYKLHLVYGAKAAPTQKQYQTINESPEPITFSWEVTTTPVVVKAINSKTKKPFAPTAHLTINSATIDPQKLKTIEEMLYGGGSNGSPKLPTPDEIYTILTAGG